MKKLYTILALLMFTCFVTTFSALMLNKTIDKAASKANSALDVATDNLNKDLNTLEGLEKGKVFHKAYFANCFPYVCAKFSFASLYLKSSEFSEAEEKEITNEVKYDLGTTAYFIAKYNPLTGSLFADTEANNIIINKNGEKFASVFFNKLTYDISADTLEYYKSLYDNNSTVEDLMSKLAGKADIKIEGLKIAIEDERFKADDVIISTETLDQTEDKVSSIAKIKIKGATSNNSPVKTDFELDGELKDFSKELVEKTYEIFDKYETAIQATTGDDAQKLVESNAEFTVSYMELLLKTVSNMNNLGTNVKLNNLEFKIYDESKEENSLLMHVKSNLDISLDEKLNPMGLLNVTFSSDDKDLLEIAKVSKIKIPKKGAKRVNLFAKQDDNTYFILMNATNGKINLNNVDELDVDGLIGDFIKLGNGLVSVAKMSLGLKM